MRGVVTGATGFVGPYLVAHLQDAGDEVVALPESVDIADVATLIEYLERANPDVVYHLAALSHPGASWDAPLKTFQVNALGTLALLEAVRSAANTTRVVLISSAEVYGRGDGEPLDERAPLRPVTPYASSKVAAEFVGLQAFLGRGVDVVTVRPFNHVGPGQADTFVVSALARRVAEAERDQLEVIRVGNLEAARDFTDVRDVVRAYRLLAEHGESGQAYNVCSGRAISIGRLLEEIVELSGRSIKAEPDPTLMRPVDVAVFVGNGAALARLTRWRPEIDWHDTLRDVLADWRARLASA